MSNVINFEKKREQDKEELFFPLNGMVSRIGVSNRHIPKEVGAYVEFEFKECEKGMQTVIRCGFEASPINYIAAIMDVELVGVDNIIEEYHKDTVKFINTVCTNIWSQESVQEVVRTAFLNIVDLQKIFDER